MTMRTFGRRSRMTRVASFLCPSSTLPIGSFYCGATVPGIGGPARYPGNNYFASIGPCSIPWADAKPPGIFMIMCGDANREAPPGGITSSIGTCRMGRP